MTDEAAEPREPTMADASGAPGPAPGAGTAPGATTAPDAGPPPPWGDGQPAGPPPPAGGFTSRYGLVRPQQGRYLAGVCAAIGRATNTDPILWRVLLAILGFFGGIGILVYVAAWLIIPAEGDTASPVESMLGRGRSSMPPVTVIALSLLVALMFGLIVSHELLAVLLGAAVLIGGALLLNRNTAGNPAGANAGAPPGPPAPPPGPQPSPASPTAAYPTPAPPYGPSAGQTPPPAPAPGYPSGGAPQPPYPTTTAPGSVPPGQGLPVWPAAAPADPIAPRPASGPIGAPPPGGYRPPFAPRGPYAGVPPYPPGAVPQPPQPPRPPKPPRERSPLGAATFSMIFLVIGAVAVLDLANVISVGVSAYFASALVTIALGLLVGAWFGRARWLIALGLAAVLALGTSTLAVSVDQEQVGGTVAWRPDAYESVADRYATRFGDATLDLYNVDFTNREAQITVQVDFGQLRVIVPPDVDVTAIVDVNAGDARVFSERWSGLQGPAREVRDLGHDGPGGGKLRLYVHVNAGDLEVTR